MDDLRRETRRVQGRIAEIERLSDAGGTIARSLVGEAQTVNLLPATGSSAATEPRLQLESILAISSDIALNSGRQVGLPEDTVGARQGNLLGERQRLRRELQELRERLESVRGVTAERSDLVSELQEQQARLRSLELMGTAGTVDRCPICQNDVTERIPGVEQLNEAFSSVSAQLRALPAGSRTESLIGPLQSEAGELRIRLTENADALATVENSTRQLVAARDERQQQARVLGRISLYLDTAREDERLSALRTDLVRMSAELQELEARVSPDVVGARVEFALSRVSSSMSEQARQIGLEYADSPMRIDPRRLTVVADTPQVQVPMNQMGSGENWVGCHMIAHLSLHAWLANQSQPVINVLFLDQPSQVYFPSDREWAERSQVDTGDRAAAERLLRLAFDAVAANAGDFQVVLTDHADMTEEWFEASVVERWRNGGASVPDDWPER